MKLPRITFTGCLKSNSIQTMRSSLNGVSMARRAPFVKRLPSVLDDMLSADALKPRLLFIDRGPGCYQTSQGLITKQYKAALSRHGFRTSVGDDVRWQPPAVPDVFVHRTVAAWVRKCFWAHPWQLITSQESNVARFRTTF